MEGTKPCVCLGDLEVTNSQICSTGIFESDRYNLDWEKRERERDNDSYRTDDK